MKNKPLVLIVEDEEKLRELMADCIAKTGLFTPLVAENGLTALKVLKKHERGFGFISNRIKCILLDWQMPFINGKEFIKIIRTQENFSFFKKHIPIVIVSCYQDKELLALAKDPVYGLASGYLTKPIDENILLNLLKSIIINKDAEILAELFFNSKFYE